MQSLNIVEDKRNKTISVLCNIKIKEYLSLIEYSYNDQGGIDGQRAALKTQSAKRIRAQMIDDFRKGGILPPVVIGIETEENKDYYKMSSDDLIEFIRSIINGDTIGDISIIDGMQRTTAMKDALILEGEEINEREVRVEFWISAKSHHHLYRMLVLNTGQIPWSLRRHLEVIFSSLEKEIVKFVPEISIVKIDDSTKRSAAGQFNFASIIELFLVLGTRTERVDSKEKLSEEFLKLDFIESSSQHELTEIYLHVLKVLHDLDTTLSSYNTEPLSEGRYRRAFNIFSSQPALMGFGVASAQYILGRPGQKLSKSDIDKNLKNFISGFEKLNTYIKKLAPDEVQSFLALETLNEVSNQLLNGTKIGDEQRSFFKNAFKVIFEENFEIDSLELCWRA